MLAVIVGEPGRVGHHDLCVSGDVPVVNLKGIAAGQLQMGTLGSTPTIRSLAGPDPTVPLAIVGGGNIFPLQVPPGSPIKNLDDLKGKTVLTLVGSDLHLVLVRMVKAHFGVDDPKEVGITVRGNNAITELERRPGSPTT